MTLGCLQDLRPVPMVLSSNVLTRFRYGSSQNYCSQNKKHILYTSFWLVVSTPLKQNSPIRSFSRVGVNMKNSWNWRLSKLHLPWIAIALLVCKNLQNVTLNTIPALKIHKDTAMSLIAGYQGAQQCTAYSRTWVLFNSAVKNSTWLFGGGVSQATTKPGQ